MVSLLDLKTLIAEKKTIALSVLLHTFRDSKKEVTAILELLERKGRIEKCFKTPACASQCLKCSVESFTLYRWIEPITQHSR